MHSQQSITEVLKSNGARSSTKVSTDLSDDEYGVLSLRNLLFDICNQNGGGHGGSAIGMAAIGVALYKYTMRYNPSNPEWFDRDRFVLSNGESAVYHSYLALIHVLTHGRPCFDVFVRPQSLGWV
jgi:transketolase N-terminal domain/subunit